MEFKEARLSCATAHGHRRSGGAARSSRAGARTRAGLALAPRGCDRAVMPLVSFTMRSEIPGCLFSIRLFICRICPQRSLEIP